ncbi:MAG: LPXTG cell wall anchor domain-containing protein [Acidimicrobiales bacterium]
MMGATVPSRSVSSVSRKRFASRASAVALTLGLTVGWFAAVAGAAESLTVPIDTVVRSEPGAETVLAQLDVDADLVGATCQIGVDAHNQESVHPNNDLVIRSGGASAVLADVEGESGADTIGSATLTLGETVTVALVMGSDGVFSGGFDLAFDCGPGSTGSETSVPATTIADTTTTTVATTTTTTIADSTTTTTTQAAQETTSTTEASTSTTGEVTSTTSGGDVSAGGDTNSGDELARTGTDTNNWLGVLAGLLIMLGAMLWGVSIKLADSL